MLVNIQSPVLVHAHHVQQDISALSTTQMTIRSLAQLGTTKMRQEVQVLETLSQKDTILQELEPKFHAEMESGLLQAARTFLFAQPALLATIVQAVSKQLVVLENGVLLEVLLQPIVLLAIIALMQRQHI